MMATLALNGLITVSKIKTIFKVVRKLQLVLKFTKVNKEISVIRLNCNGNQWNLNSTAGLCHSHTDQYDFFFYRQNVVSQTKLMQSWRFRCPMH